GCSIDKSVYLLKEIEQETGLNLFDRLQVAYRKGDQIVVASRHEFEELVASGEITEDTIVFNNLVTSYPELETHWEVPVKESWHAKVFLQPSGCALYTWQCIDKLLCWAVATADEK